MRVRLVVYMLAFAAAAGGLYRLMQLPQCTTASLLAAINRFADSPRNPTQDEPKAIVTLDSDDAYDMTLTQARDRNLLDVSIQGMDLLNVLADVTRPPDRPLRLLIPPGTLLEPADGDTRYQAVVVRDKCVLQIPAKGTDLHVRIPVLALSMTREIPTDIALRPVGAADKAVLALLAAPSFAHLRPSLQQYAVWTLTDNPALREFVGIYSGNGPVQPTRQDVALLAQTFREAGLDTSLYKVFGGTDRGMECVAGVSPASGSENKDRGRDARDTTDQDQDGHATTEPAIILIHDGKTTIVPR